jgi:hypothetical protein
MTTTTDIIDTATKREALVDLIRSQPLPFTMEVRDGRKRSTEQNRLQRKWMKEIADQLGDQTPEEIRGYCKLTLGVPILRAEDDEFRERYDAVFKPLPYETKIKLMMEPFDFAVTRLMTVEQKRRYLDEIQRHFAEKGIVLTQPEPDAKVTA